MKRLAVFIFAFFYLATSSGATVHYHFCMGKLAAWSLWGETKKRDCNKCGMEKDPDQDNGCCKDEQKRVKIEDDQKNNSLSFEIQKWTSSANGNLPVQLSIPLLARLTGFIPESHAPPRSSSIPLHIANCTFRI